MAERHCATAGCTGTLPQGKGQHCPRCGGTKFTGDGPKRRTGLGVVFLAILVAAGAALFFGRHTAFPPKSSPERRELEQAYELASKMTQPTSRDEAYSDVVHRAMEKGDYEFACKVGGEMMMAAARDKCLREIVDEALTNDHVDWAKRAAEEMTMPADRDAALKRIMDHAAGRPLDEKGTYPSKP